MKRLLVLFFLAVVCCSEVRAQDWQIVGTVTGRGSAAFFWNADEGIIGTGEYLSGVPARLYYTTDGGKIWNISILPNQNIQGQVTDIYFKDRQTGWCTITEAALAGWSGLYRSTDGGKSWKMMRQSQFPCGVRENSKGVYFTDRGASGTGIIHSADQGKTFSIAAVNSAPLGIDFIDDQRGYVTSEATSSAPHMITTDGGTTWNTIVNRVEAWGVIGVPSTNSFVYASEKNSNPPYVESSIEIRRPDGGVARRWEGKGNGITGGIAGWKGCRSIVYVQGQGGTDKVEGLMRSTDGGETWVNIGGPTNTFDTRFAVTGRGAVVYAFDKLGNIYKTVTGGDGTLRSTVRQDITFKNIIPVQSRECDSVTVPIELVLSNCDSARVIFVEVLDDQHDQLYPVGQAGRFIGGAVRDSVRLRYRPQEVGNPVFRVLVRLQQKDGYIEDTILTIPANGLPAAERYTIAELTGTKTIDFGRENICTGDSLRIVTLTNVGCGDLSLRNITLNSPAFELRSRVNPITLGAGDNRKYLVRFRPRGLGSHTAWLVFETRDGRDSIMLAGEGIPGTRGITIEQPPISATTCDTIEAKVRLHNVSCGELEIANVTTTQPLQVIGFTAVTLESDSTTEVTIRFAPSAGGNQTIALQLDATIGGDDFDTTLNINVSASVGQAVLSMSDVLEFDSISTCGQITLPVVLNSTGCDAVFVNGAVIDGVSTPYSIERGVSNQTILRFKSDTILITFKPDAIGEFTATLRIMTNTGERTVRLHGYGKEGQGDVTLALGGTYESLVCENVPVNVRINNGTCDGVTLDSIVLSGPHPGDFRMIDETPRNLAVGTGYDLTGTFEPTEPGLRRATIRVYYTDIDGTHSVDIEITGNGVGTAPLVASLPVDTAMQAMILSDLTMPIYVRGIANTPINAVEVTLGLNTDLLTPRSLDLTGMIIDGATIAYFNVMNDSLVFRLEFATPRTIGEGILAKVNFRTFLADTLATFIRLVRFSAESQHAACLQTSVQGGTDQVARFNLIPDCGDQLISDHMADRLGIVSILSIRPNPSRGRVTLKLDASYGLGQSTVTVYSANGKIVHTESIQRSGPNTNEVKLDIPGGSGQYFIRVESSGGSSTRSVIVKK